MTPPRGGAGDGFAAIVNGRGYAVHMRTQALRVTVGAYQDGDWHVSLIEDTYERGVLKNSELLYGPIYCTERQVHWQVDRAVTRLIRIERERVRSAAAGGTQAVAPATVR